MAKKIEKKEFEQRIHNIFPNAQFEILNYTTISKECKIKCLKCGSIKNYTKASNILKFNFCCENEDKTEIAKRELEKTLDFNFIKRSKQEIIIKHNICGQTFKRKIGLVIKNANHCPYCSNNKGIVLNIEEAQKQIDNEFKKTIKLLDYNAIRSKNTYKCLKCGLIFQQTQKNLLASRGCPKCDRFKSKGEKKIKELLEENNIYFQEQVSFDNLSNGKQKFDFVVYKDKDCKIIDYFIECNGEQHYEEKNFIRESLEIIQERDKRKRDFCIQNNYNLYEIIYKNGKLLNLDILPFMKEN